MDASALREQVASDRTTELERLGSDKVLLAATGADLSTAAVAAALDRALARQQAALTDWADAANDTALGAAFESAADTVEAARDTIADDVESDGAAGTTLLVLEDPGDDCARAGAGLIAAPLVVDRLALQSVSFFVNEADPTRADRCRDVRTAMEDLFEAAASQLDAVCEGETDWERVEAGATGAIDASYAAYVDVLSEMGFDPKPVC